MHGTRSKTAVTIGLMTAALVGLVGILAGLAQRAPALDTTSPVFEVDNPAAYSAIYAVSDVHGMSSELRKALQAANLIDTNDQWIGGKALLLVIGDSIDKGPDSVGTLDLWRSLAPLAAASGGAVIHLLGNHEVELLADPVNNLSKELSQELQSKGMSVNDLVSASNDRGAFMRAEPLAAKIGGWLFCHAGLLPTLSWQDFESQAATVLNQGNYNDPFLMGSSSIVEAKGWWKKAADRQQYLSLLNQDGFTGVVQGHQPEAYGIEDQIGSIESGHFVKIDCGASPPAGSHPIQILEFPNPAQLATGAVPAMLVISDDGSVAPLTPTNVTGDLNTPQQDDE